MIVYAAIWVSVSAAVCVGIYVTHSAGCLWALLIPTLMSFRSGSKHDEESE